MSKAKSKYKLIPLAIILALLNAALFLLLPRYRFASIVIHHSASEVDDYQSIKAFHQKRGWQDAAYHLVLSNGSTEVPLGHLEATGRYRFLAYSLATRSPIHNVTGVHLCIVGNYSQHKLPGRLRPVLAHAIAALQDRYHIPDNKILFHRDCSQSECPGRKLRKADVLKWARTLASKCPPATARQHEETLASAFFSPHTAPLWFGAVLLAANGIAVMLWFGGLAVLHRRARGKSSRSKGLDRESPWPPSEAHPLRREP